MQFDRTVGAVRIVNAGSVGMSFGDPGTYWLLLGPIAAKRIRASAYPQANDFAAGNVMHPPSEAAMLELFEKAALS